MKKQLFSLVIVPLFILFSYASGYGMDISVTHAAFQNDQEKYVEIQLYVVGSTVSYDSIAENLYQASIGFTLTFSKDGQIVNYDKFTLFGPKSQYPGDFVTIKRFALDNGTYKLSIIGKDLNDATNNFNFEKEISVDFDPEKVQLSDIQLLSNFEMTDEQNEFTKNGYYLEPAPFSFYPQAFDKLAVYLEVYNRSGDTFKASYLSYAIYGDANHNEQVAVSQRFKKLTNQPSQAMILQLPINNLPSGNYELLVELRNRDKRLVDVKNISFQRSNPLKDIQLQLKRDPGFEQSFSARLNEEKTIYALKAITPLTQGVQSAVLDELMMRDELEPKQYFLYQFFQGQYPEDPEQAFNQFMDVAKAVDRTYRSNVGYGFETDRGKIFIKYGKPTEIVHVEDEPSAPPYEIWFYDKLEESKQYNIKFIFYNPSLATNDYVLLHSNCRGERYNPRWEVELYRHAPGEQVGQNAASTQMEDNYRRNARRIWEEL